MASLLQQTQQNPHCGSMTLAELPKSGRRFWDESSAKTGKSKQASVGEAGDVRSASNTRECVIVTRLMIAAMVNLCLAGTAFAQSPLGEWQVQDGNAHIRIVSCQNTLWGVIDWTKGPPGKDVNNPDPVKRERSVMGMPILINMKPGDQQWEGEVYNAQDGQTYSSNISLKSPDVLRIEGCVLGGLLCGGENWTRVPLAKGAPSDQVVCSGLAAGR